MMDKKAAKVCPNCGNTNVVQLKLKMDVNTKQIFNRIPSPISFIYTAKDASFGFNVFVNIILSIALAFFWWTVRSSPEVKFEYGVLGDVLTLGIGGSSLIITAWYLFKYLTADKSYIFSCDCGACKHHWITDMNGNAIPPNVSVDAKTHR